MSWRQQNHKDNSSSSRISIPTTFRTMARIIYSNKSMQGSRTPTAVQNLKGIDAAAGANQSGHTLNRSASTISTTINRSAAAEFFKRISSSPQEQTISVTSAAQFTCPTLCVILGTGEYHIAARICTSCSPFKH